MADTTRNFDLKEEIRAFWSERADTFDDSASHKIEDKYGAPEWQAFLRKAMGLGRGESADGKTALDLACGTGEISRMLCEIGAEVTGLDFSDTMLALAKRKLAQHKWTAHPGDAEQLIGLDDQSFDFAVTRHLAWTLTNPEAAFAEWFRVLRPGGRLLINDGNWAKPLSFGYRVRRQLAQFIDPVPAQAYVDSAKHKKIFERLPYSEGLTAKALIKSLQEAGFEPVTQLSTRRLYDEGMRAHGIAARLRQSSENRFAVVVTRP
ncbi:MAG: class I SAM-dependent methyltransferase [Pseudomonadota bacterium]